MKLIDGAIRLSPTDLANHLACPHLTVLELAVARGELKPPAGGLPMADALRTRGEAHEAAYVEHLRATRPNIVDLREHRYDADGFAATRAAMTAGADLITQAPLGLGNHLTGHGIDDSAHHGQSSAFPGNKDNWVGRADILLKTDTPSALGSWSYVPLDTKLAKETRGSAILQLCTYALMLEPLQERLPDWFAVIAPGDPFLESRYRLADFAAYLRFVRRRLDEALRDPGDHYPVPVEHCDVCRWWQRCADRRRADDHLSLVANIRKHQIAELEGRAITTLERFASTPVPFAFKPDRGSIEALTRAREQARIQHEGRLRNEYLHELLLPIEKGRGLADLPEPSDGDMFFDFEGDPFVGRNGLEYLFGHVEPAPDGTPSYISRWVVTVEDEKAAFEEFVDRVTARWATRPGMHIYHYAAYEPSAMKRLMGRHATRQDEVDRMLRAGLFVDLYAIVRQALRASVERYSIKNLEPLYGFEREIPLEDASPQLRLVEYALEMNDPAGVTPQLRAAVASYNRDDCVSALKLRDWLESLRAGVVEGGTDVPRPELKSGDAGEDLSEWLKKVEALRARLLDGMPADPDERTPAEKARWLLAYTIDFHRREDKATHWDKYRLNKLPDEDYLDEPAALEGLEFVGTVGGTAKAPVHRYRFAPQDVGHREKDVYVRGEKDPARVGKLADLSIAARTIDIKKTGKTSAIHPERVFLHTFIDPTPIPDALCRLGDDVAGHGVEAEARYVAARRLLLNEPPVLNAGTPWRIAGETSVDRACRLALALDRSVLAIQGPPGSGKTYTGAQIVHALLDAKMTVGVLATGHKTIRHFLNGIAKEAAERKNTVPCIYKVTDESDDCPDWLTETTSNDDVAEAIQDGTVKVAAGTAWMWAREDFHDLVDVLIVDEAGQISLANVLASSMAAKSVILLGDPQQLDQPLKGSHPDGVAVSALQHVLGDSQTIPDDRGLFLEETWRLHPAVCEYTSEVFYESRLRSREGRDRHALRGTAPLDAPGLYFLPVAHEGNRNWSRDEVDVIAALAQSFVNGGEWRDHENVWHPIAWKDVLIVAPYNAQVYAIKDRLPGANVGTVDKFQGQEAPIVLYSMATSSPEEAPRGMEFLYSLNRLNVATSRAQCACVLIASPRLLEPECHTPRQMTLANAFCRYLEMARAPAAGPGTLVI